MSSKKKKLTKAAAHKQAEIDIETEYKDAGEHGDDISVIIEEPGATEPPVLPTGVSFELTLINKVADQPEAESLKGYFEIPVDKLDHLIKGMRIRYRDVNDKKIHPGGYYLLTELRRGEKVLRLSNLPPSCSKYGTFKEFNVRVSNIQTLHKKIYDLAYFEVCRIQESLIGISKKIKETSGGGNAIGGDLDDRMTKVEQQVAALTGGMQKIMMMQSKIMAAIRGDAQ